MKNPIVLIIIFILISVSSVFAAERTEMREQWVSRRDGVVMEDVEKTTSMMIPSPGATPEQVRSIVRSELKKFAKEQKKEAQKAPEKISPAKSMEPGGTIRITQTITVRGL